MAPGPHSKLRAIGRALQDEESRFIGYAEIERKSKELGFGMSVRTLRFYVDEGILPAPKKVGKTPVYEEDWILNVLLAIHLMKSRLNRSLTEIRTILSVLQEPPESLADKLSVLYEDYVKGGFLKPIERAGLVDAFFDLLTGRLSPEPLQASALRLVELVDAVANHGRWEGDDWVAPPREALLASQGLGAGPPPPEEPTAPTPAAPAIAVLPAEPVPVVATVREDEPTDVPRDAITTRRARALEHGFATRFKANFERLGRVHCPLDGKGYKAGPRERTFLKRDRSTEVIELMKQHRIYDRSLLDALPLGEAWEYQVYQRGLFGRGELKVVVSALSLSPLEELVKVRWTQRRLGPLDAKRAVEELEARDGVFHYVGILSTSGWSPDAREQVPSGRNLLCCLVENTGGTAWRVHHVPDLRWAGVERVFDPETDQEKVDRARDFMEEHLRPKGEFLIIRNLPEDLDVPPAVVQTAIEELLARDEELSVVVSGGREIIKRSRL